MYESKKIKQKLNKKNKKNKIKQVQIIIVSLDSKKIRLSKQK